MKGSKHVIYNPISWSMWANVLAVYAAFIMIGTGIITQFANFPRASYIGPPVIALGGIVLIIEWPRGKRVKGSTIPREFQQYVQPIVLFLGPAGRNLFFRAILWVGASIVCYFTFPTLIAGVVLTFSALVYFLAAFLGETWQPLDPEREERAGPQINQAPSKPPPRLMTAPSSAPPRSPAASNPYVDISVAVPKVTENGNGTARPQVVPQAALRERAKTDMPSRPVPKPTDAPTRPVPVPSDAPSRPVPQLPNSNNNAIRRAQTEGPSRPIPQPAFDTPASADENSVSSVKLLPKPQPKPKPRAQSQSLPATSVVDKFKNFNWESAKDPVTGSTYYINTTTNETTWDKPPNWDEYLAARGGEADSSMA